MVRRRREVALPSASFSACTAPGPLVNPDRKRGDVAWFPCDRQVDKLVLGASPLERAVPVLEAFGIDPYADDAWVDFLDIDLRNVPLIGPAK